MRRFLRVRLVAEPGIHLLGHGLRRRVGSGHGLPRYFEAVLRAVIFFAWRDAASAALILVAATSRAAFSSSAIVAASNFRLSFSARRAAFSVRRAAFSWGRVSRAV